MMRFAAEASPLLRRRRDHRAPSRDQARRAVGHREGDRGARWRARCRSTRCGCRASSRTRRSSSAAAGETLTIRHDTTSREAFVPGRQLALSKLGALPAGRHGRARRTALTTSSRSTIAFGELELSLLRPPDPEALIDEAGSRSTSSCRTGPSSGRRGSRSHRRCPPTSPGSGRRARLRPRRPVARRGRPRRARDGDRLGGRGDRAPARERRAERLELDAVHADWRAFDGLVRPRARRGRPLRGAQRRAAARAAAARSRREVCSPSRAARRRGFFDAGPPRWASRRSPTACTGPPTRA